MRIDVNASERLDVLVAREMGVSRSRASEAIQSGGVAVDGIVREKPSFKLEEGMVVVCRPLEDRAAQALEPADIPLKIVYQSPAMAVIDKPRGLATHPAPSLKEPTLVNALLHHLKELSQSGGAVRPGIVHRLDKETTGLLMVAKNDCAHNALARQIAERSAVRQYLAWVAGSVSEQRFSVDGPIGRDPKNRLKMAVVASGKSAVTHFRRLENANGATLLMAKLDSGRTHQIRVHLAAVGYPVLGDRVYRNEPDEHQLQLHAARLDFVDPFDSSPRSVATPPPEDFLPVSDEAWKALLG